MAPRPPRSTAAHSTASRAGGPLDSTYTPRYGCCQRSLLSCQASAALVNPAASACWVVITPACARASSRNASGIPVAMRPASTVTPTIKALDVSPLWITPACAHVRGSPGVDANHEVCQGSPNAPPERIGPGGGDGP